jgi:hypothetical protein
MILDRNIRQRKQLEALEMMASKKCGKNYIEARIVRQLIPQDTLVVHAKDAECDSNNSTIKFFLISPLEISFFLLSTFFSSTLNDTIKQCIDFMSVMWLGKV